jgi:hypothetical protein
MGAGFKAIVDEAGDCGLLGIKALHEEAPGLQLNAEGLAEHAVIVRHQHLCPLRWREKKRRRERGATGARTLGVVRWRSGCSLEEPGMGDSRRG